MNGGTERATGGVQDDHWGEDRVVPSVAMGGAEGKHARDAGSHRKNGCSPVQTERSPFARLADADDRIEKCGPEFHSSNRRGVRRETVGGRVAWRCSKPGK